MKKLSLLLTVMLLSGCATRDEIMGEWELDPVPFWETAYSPEFQLLESVDIFSVLVLPVIGDMPQDAKSEFCSNFVRALRNQSAIDIYEWPGGIVGGKKLSVTHEEAFKQASKFQCEAIAYIRVDHPRFSSPQLVNVDIRIEHLKAERTAITGQGVFDGKAKNVITGARRYHKESARTRMPDQSFGILESRIQFAGYAGFTTGDRLGFLLKPHPQN